MVGGYERSRMATKHKCQSARQASLLSLTLGLVAATSGCANKYEDLKAFVQAHNHDVVASTYRIEPPDVVVISSPTAPEINGAIRRVGGDGKITLKLLGEIKISTLTPKETAAKLEHLLSRYYVDPEVQVEVARYASKKIYVFGQVNGVGPRPFTGRDTVMDILASAQPNLIAWGARVKVIRPSANPEEVHEIEVDVDEMMKSGDLRGNFLLQEGDIVYVPPTPLGWVGLRVQEVLFPISPLVNGYTYPANVYTASKAYDNLDERSYSGVAATTGAIGSVGW